MGQCIIIIIIISTVLSKFAKEKALMLEFDIAHMANWYFGLDYVNCK